MPQRLEIGLRPELNDPAGRGLMAKARAYLGLGLEAARVLRVLTFDTRLTPNELERVRGSIFTNPVTEVSSFLPLADQVLPDFDWALWVGYRPGVRDNEGATALEAMADALGRGFGPDEICITLQAANERHAVLRVIRTTHCSGFACRPLPVEKDEQPDGDSGDEHSHQQDVGLGAQLSLALVA